MEDDDDEDFTWIIHQSNRNQKAKEITNKR